jgi:uncharacterized membrane protein YgcG
VMALATLTTNKPYLGWPRQTWDPMLLGVLLMAGAIAMRRWLSSGPNRQRASFTADRQLERDRDLLRTIANVSAGFQPRGTEAPVDRPSSNFGGGRSGGGGASGGF